MNADNYHFSYNELTAHYAAVKKRLGGLGKPAGLVPIQLVTPVPKPQPIEEPEIIWRVEGLPRNNFHRFLMEVARKHKIDPNILMKDDRRKNIVLIRRELIWGAVKNLNYSQSQVGRWLNKDHTSINHAIQMYEKENHVSA
jgi:hypothetical protein